MVLADYYLATFLKQPTWVEDLRPFRAVMMPLDLPAKHSDIDRFIPRNGSAPWIANARATYAFDMASAVRGDLPILYRESERFPFGGYKVVRRAESDRPAIVLASTGYLVHSCLKAVEALQPLGIAATVIDAYALPLDAAPVLGLARSAGARARTQRRCGDPDRGGQLCRRHRQRNRRSGRRLGRWAARAHAGRAQHSQERAHGG
jgi:hypothetical protein